MNETLVNEAKITFNDILVELQSAGFSIQKKGSTHYAERHNKKNADIVNLEYKGKTIDLNINGTKWSSLSFEETLDELAELLQVNEAVGKKIDANGHANYILNGNYIVAKELNSSWSSKQFDSYLEKKIGQYSAIEFKDDEKIQKKIDEMSEDIIDEIKIAISTKGKWLQLSKKLDSTIFESCDDSYVDNALVSRSAIEYATFLKIIGIAVKYNQKAYAAYQRTFTSIPQLITHLKSLYLTNLNHRKSFDQELCDVVDLNTDTFINEAKEQLYYHQLQVGDIFFLGINEVLYQKNNDKISSTNLHTGKIRKFTSTEKQPVTTVDLKKSIYTSGIADGKKFNIPSDVDRQYINENVVNEAVTYNTKQIIKFANKAKEIVIDASDSIKDLAIEYGDKVPKSELIRVLQHYDLEFSDVNEDVVNEGLKTTKDTTLAANAIARGQKITDGFIVIEKYSDFTTVQEIEKRLNELNTGAGFIISWKIYK